MAYAIKNPKVKEQKEKSSYDIKGDLEKFKETSKEDITQSDLQGISMTYGIKYVGSKNIQQVNEIENIFLLYANDEMDINSAKRYIADIIIKSREKNN